MPVPLLDTNAQNLPLEAELQQAFTRVLHSGHFILGPEVERLEAALAELTASRFALGVSSGTDALLLAFMALDLGPGDEVLVPTFTFFATAGCIARTGATPVFVDACPVSFNLDLADARAKITPQTKAIVPVHLFGQSADMDGVLALAEESGLAVVEDGAQAIGAATRGRPCGSLGQFGAYSFFPSKNLGGFGDGGLLVTQDPDLAQRAKILRVHGSEPKYHHHLIGANFRLDALQAALLRVKLPHYAGYTAARQANAADYTRQLSTLPGVAVAEPSQDQDGLDGLSQPAGIRLVLPTASPGNDHIWNQFTLRVLHGQRDALKDHLAQRGIGAEVYYPITMDQQRCFADLPAASRQGCEVAHQLAQEVLSLPIYPELQAAQRQEVIDAVAEFLAK